MAVTGGVIVLRIEPVTLQDDGLVISCTADNGAGPPVIENATLKVFKASECVQKCKRKSLGTDQTPSGFPEIRQPPKMQAIEKGRAGQVLCVVRGSPSPQVMWLRDNLPIDVKADERYSVATMGNPGAVHAGRWSGVVLEHR